MTKEEVQKIVDEVYPKIEKHYGISKFQECTPYVEAKRVDKPKNDIKKESPKTEEKKQATA